MNLYCLNQNQEGRQFVFQRTDSGNEHRERRNSARSSPQPQREAISSQEEAEIIRRQAEIVGAQAGSNLEQVILHEEEQREQEINETKEILSHPDRLRLLVAEAPYIRDKKVTVDKMLELVKGDVQFLKQIIILYSHEEDDIQYGRVWTSAIALLPNDETFFQGIFDSVESPDFQLACSLRIHDQRYLRSKVEEYRYSPYPENKGSVAIQRITNQRYIAEIASDRAANYSLILTAIEMLTDKKMLQNVLRIRNQVPGPVDTRDDIRDAVNDRLLHLLMIERYFKRYN